MANFNHMNVEYFAVEKRKAQKQILDFALKQVKLDQGKYFKIGFDR